MSAQHTRPECVSEAHLVYLDELRESGAINMFAARPYLREDFPDLSFQQATDILSYWMKTFPRKATGAPA